MERSLKNTADTGGLVILSGPEGLACNATLKAESIPSPNLVHVRRNCCFTAPLGLVQRVAWRSVWLRLG